jgi:hypothetical protein
MLLRQKAEAFLVERMEIWDSGERVDSSARISGYILSDKYKSECIRGRQEYGRAVMRTWIPRDGSREPREDQGKESAPKDQAGKSKWSLAAGWKNGSCIARETLGKLLIALP